MNVFCLVPSRDGTSQVLYEGSSQWPAMEAGYLRRANALEAKNGYSIWVVFDRMGRPFSGESPEAALDAFVQRPIDRCARLLPHH